jgi:hypothetical protein
MGCYGTSDIGLSAFGLGQETRRRFGHPRTLAVLTSDEMYEISWNYWHGTNGNGEIDGSNSADCERKRGLAFPCGVLDGGCSVWLQVESTETWTMLLVWAMFSGSTWTPCTEIEYHSPDPSDRGNENNLAWYGLLTTNISCIMISLIKNHDHVNRIWNWTKCSDMIYISKYIHG